MRNNSTRPKGKKKLQLNPFAPGDFAKKRVLKLVEWFSGHCHAIRAKTYHKPAYQSYSSRPSDPDEQRGILSAHVRTILEQLNLAGIVYS